MKLIKEDKRRWELWQYFIDEDGKKVIKLIRYKSGEGLAVNTFTEDCDFEFIKDFYEDELWVDELIERFNFWEKEV